MIDAVYYTALILIFLRLLCFFITVPIFFPKGTPSIVKIAFTGVIAMIILPVIKYTNVGTIDTGYLFIKNCICEVVTGLTLGYITNLIFFSARFAGQMMDMQIGFAMINMFDPSANANVSLIEKLLYWFSMLTFLLIDGHHMLIKALIESFNTITIGKFIFSEKSIMVILNAFIEFFTIGLKIAIPIVLIILITDITLGLMARTVPQLNVMILGMPVKILVGLSCLALAFPIILKLIVSSFELLPQIFKSFYKVIPLVLVFASDKTEQATPRKKDEAKKKGQVAKSKEVGLSFTLLASTMVLMTFGAYANDNFKQILRLFLTSYLHMTLSYSNITSLAILVVFRTLAIFLPIVLPIMIMGVGANYLQTGFIHTTETIKPQLSKINPLSGLKKMFSIRSLVEMFKDIAIVSIVGYEGYKFIRNNYIYILTFGGFSLDNVLPAFSKLIIAIFFKITLIMIVISLMDFIFQKRQYNKELKMTKHEVKEEMKQDEGDPQIKGKIRQKQREMASRRMMQQVPNATVVVTNPTHIAVALKYEEGKSEAPILVAKGSESVALKIKEIAKDNDVPIIENKPLARLIYSEIEIDQEIPNEMYQAVAEILALVFKLKKKK